MIVAHKVIDALRRAGGHDVDEVPGVNDMGQRFVTANAIVKAEKFDFGELVLEPDPNIPGSWKIPTMTPEEWGFWREGFIPLPAPICWYEFVIGESRSCYLVWEEGTKLSVQRMDFSADGTKRLGKGEVLYDGLIYTVDRASPPHVMEESAVAKDYPGLEIHFRGNVKFFNWVQEHAKQYPMFNNYNMAMNIALAVYLTLMINSKTTDVEMVTVSSAENRQRKQKGLSSLNAHRVVTIVPERYKRSNEGDGTSDRRPPRLHWRRSHMRVYENGKKVVIPRCLVGRAELGEVSHEYKIKHEHQRKVAAGR